MSRPLLILGSQSAMRRKLLAQVHIVPDRIIPAHIDEKPKEGETAVSLAQRLAKEKNRAIASEQEDAVIITADTVPLCEGKVLDKALTKADVRHYLDILSGSTHEVYTSICISRKKDGILDEREKTVKTTITFKEISEAEKRYYVALEEGIGKAGGCNIDGYAESFIASMHGTFSNVCGLPLYETMVILQEFYLRDVEGR